MASRTVVRDGLAIGDRMTAIMAAEAARKVSVPKIVRMCAPGHGHVWKDVSQVDIRHLLGSLLHRAPLRSNDFRIVAPIKLGYLAGDALLGNFASGVIHLKYLNRFFPDVRKVGADAPQRYLLVQSVFRHLGSVRRSVVTIQAIHHAMLASVQLFFGWLGVTGKEFGGLSVIVGVIHGRNRLPLGVG